MNVSKQIKVLNNKIIPIDTSQAKLALVKFLWIVVDGIYLFHHENVIKNVSDLFEITIEASLLKVLVFCVVGID